MLARSTAVAVLLLATAAGASAQIPEEFENLQVLRKEIPRDSLLQLMRSFSFALDVRCVYCHVGEDRGDLADVDFKSDDRPAKVKAREMMRMVADVNTRIAAMPAAAAHEPVAVRCVTCHRGAPRPVMLEDTLYRVIVTGGGIAGLEAYESLRARHHGRATYDFGSPSLIRLAERLFADERHEDAVVILQKNVELFPRGWNSYYELGRNLEALGRTEEAVAAYRAVLERLPGHRGSERRIQALTGG